MGEDERDVYTRSSDPENEGRERVMGPQRLGEPCWKSWRGSLLFSNTAVIESCLDTLHLF